MSVGFKVIRICEFCKKEFTAYTIKTKYCSKECNSKYYKDKIRLQKIETAQKENLNNKYKDLEFIKNMEFLTVKQTSILLNCSRRNIYKMINAGKISATNILQNKTLIKRIEIDKMFEKSKTIYKIQKPKVKLVELKDCYTTNEVKEKFNISDRTLKSLIDKNEIPKLKQGWYYYVPKEPFDEIFK